MPPVENQIAVHPGPGHQGGGSIPLGTLIEYALQRTYHELTVLSELLPRKTDMDRKLEIFHFANRTRQLFVRILALVKWANSATKVDKCADICHFLEQQSMYFIETADFLHKMSKETLVTARLPSFSLPCAIDVLTTGTYPRLPACIRDKIIPPDPITPVEKKQTLQRLNQVIQYRLVSSDLPRQMRRLKIEQGRVRFFVEHEFEVTLTLMGDSPTIPWRLLDITFQVEDHETGDGKSLVHSMQVHYIHQLVQSRLLDTDKPLLDLYRVLHSFCLSLQLEVLHSQTQRLMRERLGDCIFIDQYTLSKNLVISYWRDHTRNRERSLEATVYKLSVHVCEDDDGKPLQVTHFPAMSADESRKIGLAIKSDHLSIEKLLMQTIEVRTHSKLKDLSRELQRLVDGKCEVRDMPVALHVPVLTPCMSSEALRVTINVQTGAYMVSVPSCEDQGVTDIEECLNGDRRGMDGLISRLRVQLSLLRCEKSVQLMPAVCQKSLPFVNLSGHPLEALAPTKLFIRVPRQPNVYVVVEIIEEGRGHVKYRYFLLQSVPCTLDGTEDDIEDTGVKSFLKAGHMIPVDIFSQTHGPFCRLYDDMPLQMDSLSRKRKIFLGEMDETENKKTKGSPYFVQELTYLLAHVEEKIPFVQIGEELILQGLSHTGISVDNEGTCLSLGVLGFPDTGDTNAGKFHEQLLSCKFRIQCRASRNWIVEFVFARGPLPTTHFKESGSSVRVCLHFDLSGDNIQKTVTDLLDEWQAMQHLYFLVVDFADTYNDVRTNMMAMATIQSYDYRKLTLTYGPGRSHFVTVQWKTEAHQFQLSLGTLQQSSTANPHVPLLVQLQEELNTSRSLAQLVHTLHDTWAPMTAICKLNTTSLMGTSTHPKQAVLNFTIIPQSSTHVRLIFRSCYCLDIHMKTGKVVAVRDGSYGLFDNSRVIEGLTPASGLKSFLSMFVDEKMTASHGRQRSSTEDDNPPSPIGMDMDVFMSQQQQPMLGSPATSRQLKDSSSGFRFHNNPMTPPSNPHTPASPGASRMPTGVNPSPSAALIGTPSPGTLLTANSPSNPQLHVPSPQSFVPTPSPQGLGLHMQSPAASFISPVMSPPSRILPQRAWAAAVPTLLSHEMLTKLLTASPLQGTQFLPASPLERFFACVHLRRHMQRVIQSETSLTPGTSEPGVVSFRVESLQCKISLNPSTHQSLHLKVTPTPDFQDQWTAEEMQILERFFDLKVVCPPYKVNLLTAFGRLMGAPLRILKDCIQIMRLELMPDRSLKWSVQWCLTIPPSLHYISPPGTPAILVKSKMIFMLQFTRIGLNIEAQSLCVPMLYEISQNKVQQVDQHSSPALAAIATMLSRFAEMHHNPTECAIFPAVRELMSNLVIPMSSAV